MESFVVVLLMTLGITFPIVVLAGSSSNSSSSNNSDNNTTSPTTSTSTSTNTTTTTTTNNNSISTNVASTPTNIRTRNAGNVKDKTTRAVNTTTKEDDDEVPVFIRLENQLLRNYKPYYRPVRSHWSAVNVTANMHVSAIHEVNEFYQTIKFSAWIDLRWTDELLTWEPEEYEGLNRLELPNDKIWVPQLCISNSAVGNRFPKPDSTLLLTSDGSVLWVPFYTLETLCSMDITYYPFDEQKCTVTIEKWTTQDSEEQRKAVNITTFVASPDTQYFWENAEWRLEAVSVERVSYIFEGMHYMQSNVILHLKRRRLFHSLTLLVPNVLLAVLAGLVFALPEQSGEKMSFSMTLLLAFTVNLSVLVEHMPSSSVNVSYFVIYLTSLSFVTALSIVTTVCQLSLYHKVGVVGPKVKAVTLSLHRGLGSPLASGVNGVTSTTKSSDVKLKNYATPKSEVMAGFHDLANNNENAYQDTATFDVKSSDKDDVISLCQRHREDVEGVKLRKNRDDGIPNCTCNDTSQVTWKDVAETVDYVCLRLFPFVIICMTSVLIVTLFVGQ